MSRSVHERAAAIPLYRDLSNAHLPVGNGASRLPDKFDSNPWYCDVEQDRCCYRAFSHGHDRLYRVGVARRPGRCRTCWRTWCCTDWRLADYGCCLPVAVPGARTEAGRTLSCFASAVVADAVSPAFAVLPLVVLLRTLPERRAVRQFVQIRFHAGRLPVEEPAYSIGKGRMRKPMR